MVNDEIWNLIAKKLSGEANPEELLELEKALRLDPDLHYSLQAIQDIWISNPRMEKDHIENAFAAHEKRLRAVSADYPDAAFPLTTTDPFSEKTKNRLLKSLLVLTVLAVAFFGTWYAVQPHAKANALSLMEEKRPSEVSTQYGTRTKLLLPDGSSVWLNSGSRLSYDSSYGELNREVSLTGEAFFDVKHLDNDHKIENHERFVVHTENTVVEVLGTSFDIRERRGKTEISLQRGSIRVIFSKGGRQPVLMKPGDILLVDSANVLHHTSNIEHAFNASSWKEKKLVLSNPSLSEIFKYLEDTYGKSFILEDPDLARKRLNGPILIDSLEDALFVMSTALNISFTNEGDSIRVNFK